MLMMVSPTISSESWAEVAVLSRGGRTQERGAEGRSQQTGEQRSTAAQTCVHFKGMLFEYSNTKAARANSSHH